MKWLTFEVQQTPGFRFNLIDLLLILLLLGLATGLKLAAPGLSLYAIPVYVGFTFFLFCNVFRIGNRAEVWWYLPFLPVAIAAVYTLRLEAFWWTVLLFFEPLKALLVVRAMRQETYHGAFYQWVAYPARRFAHSRPRKPN